MPTLAAGLHGVTVTVEQAKKHEQDLEQQRSLKKGLAKLLANL